MLKVTDRLKVAGTPVVSAGTGTSVKAEAKPTWKRAVMPGARSSRLVKSSKMIPPPSAMYGNRRVFQSAFVSRSIEKPNNSTSNFARSSATDMVLNTSGQRLVTVPRTSPDTMA